MSQFEVSIVIPVFNRPDLLREVLRGLSLQSFCLEQVQVLVADDGSTDDLHAVTADFCEVFGELRLLSQQNKGPASARNLGTRAAAAPVVLYLDSDVLPDSNLVAELMSALTDEPEWVGAEARVIPVNGEDNALWDAPVCEEGGVFLTAAIAYRTSFLKAVGGFDESFRRAACEDVELAARMLPFGQIGFVKSAVVRHPRRKRNFRWYWNKRADWKYVLFLAQRHGFIGWPGNTTRFPRTRLLFCALVTQPAGRLRSAFRLFGTSSADGVVAAAHAVFSVFCGLAAVKDLLSATVPPARDYLTDAPQEAYSRAA